MKTSIIPAAFSSLLFSIVILSCSSDDDANPSVPDITPIIDGYLCTIGLVGDFKQDTLVFDVSSHINQDRGMVEYSAGSENPKNQVTLITQGIADVFLIKLKTAYEGSFDKLQTHLGILPDPTSFPEYPYYFAVPFEGHDVSELQFVLKRSSDDNTKFTIESKKYPGNYLNIIKPVGSYNSKLIFVSSPREFFFKK